MGDAELQEVSKHRDASTGIWVTFKGHVYDVTEFVQVHPGGMQKIMLAAGSSIEPFWGIYKQHDKPEVRALPERDRRADQAACVDVSLRRVVTDGQDAHTQVRDILEQYKIGKLAGGASEAAMVKIEDPFKNDPHRHPALLTRSAKPFNGETPGELLVGATKHTSMFCFALCSSASIQHGKRITGECSTFNL